MGSSDIPLEIQMGRMKKECHGRAKVEGKESTINPSFIIGNVRSLDNRMDELGARFRHHREVQFDVLSGKMAA